MEFITGFEILETAAKSVGLARAEDIQGAAIQILFKALQRYRKKYGEIETDWNGGEVDRSQVKARRILLDEILNEQITSEHELFTKPNLWGVGETLHGGALLSVNARKKTCYTIKNTKSKTKNTETANRTASCNDDILKMLEVMKNDSKADAAKTRDEIQKVNKQLETVATTDYVNTYITELHGKVNKLTESVKIGFKEVDRQVAEKFQNLNLTDEMVKNVTAEVKLQLTATDHSSEVETLTRQLREQELRLKQCESFNAETVQSGTEVKRVDSAEKILQEYNMHVCQKSAFLEALRYSRSAGNLKCVLLSERYYTVENDGYIKLNVPEINMVLNSSTYVKECYKNGKNNVICSLGLDRNVMNRSKVVVDIIAERRELAEKFKISVSVLTPRQYDITPTLVAWEKSGLIVKKDSARSGLMKIWINDAPQQDDRNEFLKACTILIVFNPLKLIKLLNPTTEKLVDLAKGVTFVGDDGIPIATPEHAVEKEKTRPLEEQSQTRQNERGNGGRHQRGQQSQRRTYARPFQNQQYNSNQREHLVGNQNQGHQAQPVQQQVGQEPEKHQSQTQSQQQNQQPRMRAPFIGHEDSSHANNYDNQLHSSQMYDPNKPTRYVQDIPYGQVIRSNRYYDPSKGGSSKPVLSIINNENPQNQRFVYNELADHHHPIRSNSQNY